VHEPDPHRLDLDDAALGERGPQCRLVHVPVDGLDRRDRRELPQHRGGGDVARVEDQVGAPEFSEARLRQAPRPARQVRVGDDGDACQTARKRPSR
jgi:hypothetical protein